MVCWGDNQPCAGAEATSRLSLLRGGEQRLLPVAPISVSPVFSGLLAETGCRVSTVFCLERTRSGGKPSAYAAG